MRSTCFISEGSCSRGIRAVETSKAPRNGNKTTTEALCWQCSSNACCVASRGGSSASQVPSAVAVRASRCHRPQDLDVLAHPSYRTEAEKPSVSFSHPADPTQCLTLATGSPLRLPRPIPAVASPPQPPRTATCHAGGCSRSADKSQAKLQAAKPPNLQGRQINRKVISVPGRPSEQTFPRSPSQRRAGRTGPAVLGH